MRFGFVARLTLALALLALSVFALRMLFTPKQSAVSETTVVQKQPLPPVSSIPDFGSITDVKQKKLAFFNFIRPGITEANNSILEDRQFISRMLPIAVKELTSAQFSRIRQISAYYRLPLQQLSASDLTALLIRVDIVPSQLVMVQAANESGWGTSRFSRLGLNFFGQWCFSKGCGLVPSSRNNDANHEVKVFDSVEDSIASYLRNINTHTAYRQLRDTRAALRQHGIEPEALQLVGGLRSYSQREDDYVNELIQMLRHNRDYL